MTKKEFFMVLMLGVSLGIVFCFVSTVFLGYIVKSHTTTGGGFIATTTALRVYTTTNPKDAVLTINPRLVECVNKLTN